MTATSAKQARMILGLPNGRATVYHSRENLFNVLGSPKTIELVADESRGYKLGYRERSNDGLKAMFVLSNGDQLWLYGEMIWRDGAEWVVNGKLVDYEDRWWRPEPGEITQSGLRRSDRIE